MFISRDELKSIRNQIAFLQDLAVRFQNEINELQADQKENPRKGRNWTPEQRAKASERMKSSYAKAKEKS
jgi:hypothetical protein